MRHDTCDWSHRCEALVGRHHLPKCKDVASALDLPKARRSLQEQKRVNVDFPSWMIESPDREASRLGVTRQSIIKVWVAERLSQAASEN